VSASQDQLIDIFNRIERSFCLLEIYTSITSTTTMTNMMIDITVKVLTILAITQRKRDVDNPVS
jgi:hypothetical protein